MLPPNPKCLVILKKVQQTWSNVFIIDYTHKSDHKFVNIVNLFYNTDWFLNTF